MADRLNWMGLGPLPTELPPPDYAYRCEDKGYLKPLFYRLFVTPIAQRLSPSIKANDLTILGELFSIAPVVIFLFFARTAPGWVIATIPGIGLFLYVVIDHLDGTHARRTNTSSPLGEFLDHWLDAWNGGLVTMAVGLAWGAQGAVLPTLAMFGALAYALAISEQKATGVLRLDALGGNEGMMMICGTYLILGWMGPDAAHAIPLPYVKGYTFGQLLLFLCWWGTVGTCKNVFLRSGVKATMPDCLPIVANGLIATAWAAAGLQAPIAALIVSVAGAICAGRIVLARTAGIEVRWDGLGLTALALGYLATLSLRLDAEVTAWVGLTVLLVLVLRALADFAWSLAAFGRYIRRGELLSFLVPASDDPAPAPAPAPREGGPRSGPPA